MVKPSYALQWSWFACFRLLSVFCLVATSSLAQAWFDDDWDYKATFVANNSGGTLLNQQVQIDLSVANVNPAYVWSIAGDDIRVLAADDVTPLEYYIENWNSFGKTARIFVQIPSLPSGNTTIHVYYGNAAAPDASNPLSVLTEVGLRYHTRQSSFDPTSKASALAEFNGLDDSITGYGCKTVTSFNLISNQSEFPSGANSDILFFSNNHFEVTGGTTGTWNFRFAGDYGRGGGLYLDNADSDEKWNDDLWWGFNWNNTSEILTVSASLSSGYHNLQMLGAEGCCDGGTSVEYQNASTGYGAGDWQLWTTSTVNIRSEKCEVVDITSTTTSSNLTTSTKTFVDINGADVEPGDVLRYTITLNESVGNDAEHVALIDNIQPQLGSLNIISFPVGATDSSTPSGGTHSVGLVDITDITVPGGGSVTVVYDVTVLVVPVGQTIDNLAELSNPSGAANDLINAPTIVVAVNSLPIAGVKHLYLYDDLSFSRVIPGTAQGDVVINHDGDSRTWTLNPALQTPLTIDKSTDMSISLFVQRAGDLGWAIREVRVEINGSVNGLLGSYQDEISIPSGTGSWHNFPITLAQTVSPTTLDLGETITLTITNLSDPAYPDHIRVNLTGTNPLGGANDTTFVQFPSNTVINVDNIVAYDAAYPAGVVKTFFGPGETAYLRAVVSDPFGQVDINSASIAIIDITPTTVLATTAMTAVVAAGALKTFEYAYTVPGFPAAGLSSITVIADEGAEGLISDSGVGAYLVVLPPSLTTVMTSSSATGITGDPIIYTIITTNTGPGDAQLVSLNDALAPFTALRLDSFGPGLAFECTAGCPGSGLTLGTASYSDDAGGTYVYTPVSGGGGAPANHDTEVDHWLLPMLGDLPGGGSAFTIRFHVVIE